MPAETEGGKDQGRAIVAYRSPSRRSGWAAMPTVVLLDAGLSDAAVRLYGLLVSYAFQSEGFYVYQGKIAEDLARSVRAVQRSLAELADRGLVTIERQGITKPNIYWLEDPYGLYDTGAQQAEPGRTVRAVAPRSGDKNGVSDTTEMAHLEATNLSPSYKTLQKEESETKEISTFNVAGPRRNAPLRTPEHQRLANQAVALTGDEKSRKRYQQLAGIVDETGAWALWDTAYRATQARLTKSREPLDAPGAYFCATLTKLLADAGVYVPVGTPAEREDIRAQIAASLGQAAANGVESDGVGEAGAM